MAFSTLLTIFMIHRFVTGTSSPNGVFSIQPSDVTVEVGGNATFECQTENCEKIAWIHYEAGTNQTSKSIYRGVLKRKDVVVTTTKCASKLTLLNVRPAQNGDLVCSLSVTSNKRSDSARLTVIQPPNPVCILSPSTPQVNDLVSLLCRVPSNAEVPTLLSWYSAGTNAQSVRLSESRVTEPGSLMVVKRHLSGSDNYQRFICIAGWGGSQGPNCSVTPLRVQVGYVAVAIAKKYRSENGKLELDLECRSEAVPDMWHYSWTVREVIMDSSSNVTYSEFQDVSWNETSGFLRISDCMSFNSLVVTCFASNAVGQNATSEHLNVSRCEHSTNPNTAHSFGIYLWVILPVFAMITISVLCLFCKHTYRAPSATVDGHDSAGRVSGRSTRLTAGSSSKKGITVTTYIAVEGACSNPKPPALPPPRDPSRTLTMQRAAKQSGDTDSHQQLIDTLYAKPNKSTRSIESIEMSEYATISPRMTDS